MIEANGWAQVTTRGSHRQFRHATKQAIRRLGIGHAQQHTQAGRAEGGEIGCAYAVVIEKAGANYSAYVPDLPACVANGDTPEEAEQEIRNAVRFHLEGLKEDGIPAPEPQVTLAYVEA